MADGNGNGKGGAKRSRNADGGGTQSVGDLQEAKKRREEEERKGASVAARAENGQGELGDSGDPEPKMGEDLFVWEQGKKVTLANLIDRNTPVEHVFVFGGKRIKGRGGLMGLSEQPVLIVRGMSGGVNLVPTHDDDGKVTKVVLEQRVNAQLVVPAKSAEGASLAGPLIDAYRAEAAEPEPVAAT